MNTLCECFSKKKLHQSPGRVLELGCGSGNNLMLFHEFGWQVVGIDISADTLSDAAHNLSGKLDAVTILQSDLAQGMPELSGKFDAILLPSINYYIPRASFYKILGDCSRLLKPGGLFFIRSRTCDDWRYGRGREVEPNGFVLEASETGEKGSLNVFYEVEELAEECSVVIGELSDRQVLRVNYENTQGGLVISNADVVIWGRR